MYSNRYNGTRAHLQSQYVHLITFICEKRKRKNQKVITIRFVFIFFDILFSVSDLTWIRVTFVFVQIFDWNILSQCVSFEHRTDQRRE